MKAHASDIASLVDQHAGQLYNLGLRFCGSSDEAEDLVQEVFLQASRSWDQFRGESDVRTWLYRIAARACQRMHRKRSGEPDRIASLNELLPMGEPLIAQIPSNNEGVFQSHVRKEVRERLEHAIASLPDDFRVPIILKEIVGFSVAEVADILDLEPATVRTRVHRARLKLRYAVDKALPRTAEPVPQPAYPEQTCLDLLDAKQQALDRGVPFNTDVICQRCQSVFATLDLTQQVCRDLATGKLPEGLRDRLAVRIASE